MDINAEQNLYRSPDHPGIHCYIVNVTIGSGLWQSENPISQALPILALQLATIIIITRILQWLFKPYHIPLIVANIMGGILIGPTALGNLEYFQQMFPLRALTMLETVSYWALTCHVFLLGLETDVASVLRTGKRAIHVAAFSAIFPLAVGSAIFLMIHQNRSDEESDKSRFIYFAAPLAMTGFPAVSRILVELKLIHTDLGRLAMSSALVTDLVGWVFVVILIPSTVSFLNAIYSVLANVAFILLCSYAIRPVLGFLIRSTTAGGNNVNEHYLSFIMASVSLFACATEVLGTGSLVGAFVFGAVMPDRVIAGMLADKFEYFMSGYLLPLYFVTCGLKINLQELGGNWAGAAFAILLSGSLKVIGALIATSRYKIPRRDAFALGMISNTKGIISIFIANLATEKQILSSYEYATLVLSIAIMTGATGPVVANMYRPAKRFSHYKQRTIQQKARAVDSETRVLACFQGPHNIRGMINLFDSSTTTKESPLNVFALHLVELTGRASAMLIVHNQGKSRGGRRDPNSEQILTALETFASLNDSINVSLLTALSPFVTMHDDICSLAEERRVSFVILPFHKPPARWRKLDEEGNTSFRGVNLNVLANAPCTVGLFVDKGFGGNQTEDSCRKRKVAMLFFGGPDDREALAYASRTGASGVVNLRVVRFQPVTPQSNHEIEGMDGIQGAAGQFGGLLAASAYIERQKKLDQMRINEFRLRSAGQEMVSYEEKVVNGEEEVLLVLREMAITLQIDLFLVGKGEGVLQPLTAALLDWCEYPELGAIGDSLVAMGDSRSSVLVVQRYIGPEEEDDELEDPRREHMVDVHEPSEHSREHLRRWLVPGEEDEHRFSGGLEMETFDRQQT